MIWNFLLNSGSCPKKSNIVPTATLPINAKNPSIQNVTSIKEMILGILTFSKISKIGDVTIAIKVASKNGTTTEFAAFNPAKIITIDASVIKNVCNFKRFP